MEFRLVAPTDYRLNAHVILNDDLPLESLTAFKMHLKLTGPDGKSPTQPNFIKLATSYDDGKLGKHGFKAADRVDKKQMYRLGMMTAEISCESLREAIGQVGTDNCLFMLPYDTNDGVEALTWEIHSHTDSTLMKWADCFETRSEANVNLFLGHGHPTNPQIGIDFIKNLGGHPKPVFSGSDAHSIAKYGVYPSNRATWLKCNQPSRACVRSATNQHFDATSATDRRNYNI